MNYSQSNQNDNRLRSWLTSDSGPAAVDYAEMLECIEQYAKDTWIPLLGEDKGSLIGIRHFKGVERQVNLLISRYEKPLLTPAETFILLVSILYHDIGKLERIEIEENKKKELLKINPQFFNIDDSSWKGLHHATRSAATIYANRETYRIPDSGLARCIAVACAAHFDNNVDDLRKQNMLEDCYLDCHGRIRIAWLAALLILADELDNSYQRVVPEWMIKSDDPDSKHLLEMKDSDSKGQFRIRLLGCEPDFSGRLIKLHLDSDIAEKFRSSDDPFQILFYLLDDVYKKRRILELFYKEYRQMRMELFDVAVCIDGHLLGPKDLDNEVIEFDCEIYFIDENKKKYRLNQGVLSTLIAELQKRNEERKGSCFKVETIETKECEYTNDRWHVFRIPVKSKVHQSDRRGDSRQEFVDIQTFFRNIVTAFNQHEAVKKLVGFKRTVVELKTSRKSFCLMSEPSIRQMKIDRILDSALQIRFENFGKTTFPWETLATHAGLESVDEARLIFHRISLFSNLYWSEQQNGLHDLVPLPENQNSIREGKSTNLKFRLIELDGEWTILFEGDPTQDFSKDNASKEFRNFYQWFMPIVTNRPVIAKSNSDRIPDKIFLEITNENLAFLFDEAKIKKLLIPSDSSKESDNHHGILLTESQSLLFREKLLRNEGINMVISGPPGIGKSTLAMEFIARSKAHEYGRDIAGKSKEIDRKNMDSRSVAAYFSLEQPLESICDLAKKTGLKDHQIKTFFYSNMKDDHRKYILPYYRIYRQLLHENDTEDKKFDNILMLPKLAPRSYGQIVDEDRLFWFRYKQIARVLEAHKDYRFQKKENTALLSIVVIDNLNAFAQHPLIRQRIHQLFQLIAWGGVLGIFLVEDSPVSETDTFRSEVEFLSDILVRLDWSHSEYSHKTIEVVKTRLQRHVLGKHPFKISFNSEPETENENPPKDPPHQLPTFHVFPSIHCQITRFQRDLKSPDEDSPNKEMVPLFAFNHDLCKLVQKNRKTFDSDINKDKSESIEKPNTGIGKDSFIVLRGMQGGHKLAIGMNYVNGIQPGETAIVLNMGQSIDFQAVAGYDEWKKENGENEILKTEIDKKSHPEIPKVDLTQYSYKNKTILIVDFHVGFLLPEEFLEYVNLIIKREIKALEDIPKDKINRILFSSTAHLYQRFPLLYKDVLLPTALVKILKDRGIGLMMIAVDGAGQTERLDALTAMADININVMRVNDGNIPKHISGWYESIQSDRSKVARSPFIISSDNVTGKDYQKEYAVLSIEKEGEKSCLKLERYNPDDSKKFKLVSLLKRIRKN